MSTLEIVVFSMLGGIVILALMLAIGGLIWLAFDMRRVQKQTKEQVARNEQETKVALDSAKSSFAAIRSEMKSILEDHRKQITALLDDNRKAMQAGIEKINAEALTAAAVRCFEACQRLEKSIAVFQKLILENTDQRMPNEYAAEEYAPERSEFGGPPSAFSLSLAAQADAEAERETAVFTETQPDR